MLPENESFRRLLSREPLTERDAETILRAFCDETRAGLAAEADRVRRSVYGTEIFLRGLIEFTNFCKNNCLYCGLRRGNAHVSRYRLRAEEILDCCGAGYELGYRTFVLQGGEDPVWTPEKVEKLVREIKSRWPDCALTLSLGEFPREVYAAWRAAGADRYLLRHETASADHYRRLHPPEMSFDNRVRCLWDLKELGYAVGCGMMVGSPFQTVENLAADLMFIQELQPDMVGIGPFIPQHDTPFANEKAGTLEMTLYLLSVIRLMLPEVLLPATTALGTIHPRGREMGILAGANVCMPNLSPDDVRGKYAIYDHKLSESADRRRELSERFAGIGYQTVVSRGDRKRADPAQTLREEARPDPL